MTKALIIEDEQRAIDLLSQILSQYCKGVSLVGTASDFESSISLIKESDFSLLFMDIQLKDCTAFDILDTIEKRRFDIVFTTAFNTYAIKAFEYGALHYLLKPYSPTSVVEAVDRVAKQEPKDISSLREAFAKLSKPLNKYISVKTNKGIHRIEIEQIIRVEADRSYSTIHLKGADPIVTSKPLKDLENLLVNHSFYRTHQSHLINMDQVKQYLHRDGGSILLSCGASVPLSRRKKNDFISLLS